MDGLISAQQHQASKLQQLEALLAKHFHSVQSQWDLQASAITYLVKYVEDTRLQILSYCNKGSVIKQGVVNKIA